MGETDQADSVVRATHVITVGRELFCDGAMTDDHSWDGRRVVRVHENTTRGECVCVVGGHEGERRCRVGRKAEETNSIRVMRVASGIEETDLGTVPG